MEKISLFLEGWASSLDMFGLKRYKVKRNLQDNIKVAWTNVGKVIYASTKECEKEFAKDKKTTRK